MAKKSDYSLLINFFFNSVKKQDYSLFFSPSIFTIHYFLAHYSLFIIKKGHYSLIIIPHPDSPSGHVIIHLDNYSSDQSFGILTVNQLHLEYLQASSLANSEDPDEMPSAQFADIKQS